MSRRCMCYSAPYHCWVTRLVFLNSDGTVKSERSLDGSLRLLQAKHASDGTVKLLFSCGDSASSVVETVLIPLKSGPSRTHRFTSCVSSQGMNRVATR